MSFSDNRLPILYSVTMETIETQPASLDGATSRYNLGELLRNLRMQHNLSVRTLAGLANCSPSFISQV